MAQNYFVCPALQAARYLECTIGFDDLVLTASTCQTEPMVPVLVTDFPKINEPEPNLFGPFPNQEGVPVLNREPDRNRSFGS